MMKLTPEQLEQLSEILDFSCPLSLDSQRGLVETAKSLYAEIQWWKDHAVVIIDGDKKLKCYLKDEQSMCAGIEAESHRLRREVARLEQALTESQQKASAV